MKRQMIYGLLAAALLVAMSAITFGQARPPIPRASQKASAMQTVGTTDMTITYSRPAVKGRTVWGDPPADKPGEGTLDDGRARPAGSALVPFGHVWRTGANEATLFTVTDDVLVNGQPLAAGKYSLHTIPGKEEWTIIFNKDDGQWGSFAYDAKKDALRVKAKAQWLPESKEFLYFRFDTVSDNSTSAYLRWEKVKVPFTIEVKDVVGSTMAKLQAYVAGAKSDDPGPALNAANYAKANKQNEAATKWFDMALKASDEQIKAKANFANLGRRANILVAAGRMQEALAAAEKALEAGKAEKADTAALEKRIADMKAGKQ
ncbi:MAG: DUF2911 domain-containing protein [Pyrinomonadaceae bacterium]